MQVCANLHVEILKSPREEETFSTWARNKTSEESNETSEEMNLAHVENKKTPRGYLTFSTWRSFYICLSSGGSCEGGYSLLSCSRRSCWRLLLRVTIKTPSRMRIAEATLVSVSWS